MQAMLWGAAGACAAGAIGAAWREARRMRRRDPDAVGPIDWRTVQLAAIAGTILFVALAIGAVPSARADRAQAGVARPAPAGL